VPPAVATAGRKARTLAEAAGTDPADLRAWDAGLFPFLFPFLYLFPYLYLYLYLFLGDYFAFFTCPDVP
jgi:hypothetical protein